MLRRRFLTCSLIFASAAAPWTAASAQLPSKAQPQETPKKAPNAAPPSDPLKGLRKKHDKMQGITWYDHPSSPTFRNRNGVYLMFGKNDDGRLTKLRFVMQYAAEEWLFVRKAWAKADGVRLELPQVAGALGWERDNGAGGIFEWSDAPIDSKAEADVIKTIANAKDVTIRFEGRQYYNDKSLSSVQLKALREMISAYEAAQGRPLP